MLVEISAFSVHVHPLFDLMFVVSSIPRLHTAAYHLHKICILKIIEFPWEWNLIKNGGFDANEAGTSLTSAILFWWEPVHTNEQQESINGRSTGSPLQMSRKPEIRPTSRKVYGQTLILQVGTCGGPSDLPRFPDRNLLHIYSRWSWTAWQQSDELGPRLERPIGSRAAFRSQLIKGLVKTP